MKNKLTKELQKTYQEVVDSVEEFVVKEGKTLQQAFHATEEKLYDAKEISKDKIQQASKYLKDNLRLLGETVEETSEAYKEQIKFNLNHVNHSIWDKLHRIANTNTSELIEFTKIHKEKAQAAIKDDHISAHLEHNQWGSEHDLWLDEVQLWEEDHVNALTKLTEIENALKQHSVLLAEHVQVIQAHAKIDHEHEEVMKAAEQDLNSKASEVADKKEMAVHQQERQIHAKHSELHHSLKSHHLKIMAMINMLHKEAHKSE